MSYKFHHVGTLTADREQNIKVMRDLLGHVMICEYDGENKTTFMKQKNGIVSVALFEKPLNDAYASLVDKTDIMHIAFETEDIEAARKDLEEKGAEILWAGDVFWDRPTIGVRTPEGLIAMVVEHREDVFEEAPVTPMIDETRASFNHIGVLSARFRESERWWTKMFNLRRTYEISANDSGYYVLVDEFFEEGVYDFTIEFFTGPLMYPIDQYAVDEKGESYYHYGYLSPGIENIKQVFTELVDAGLFPAQETCVDEVSNYATAFLHGPDKIIYEFLTESLGAIEATDEWDPAAMDGIYPAIPYPAGRRVVVGVKGGVEA